MKKFVFGVFVLLTVGLFTNPLFAKTWEKVPECVSGCNYMQSCYAGRNYDIYNCGGSYAAVSWQKNCRWDVKMNDAGQFMVSGDLCRSY